jgi:hypothetical protein
MVKKYTKLTKIYQMDKKYTKWQQNGPYGHTKYQHLPLQDPPKFTQIGIFGFQICHLATPIWSRAKG